MMTRLLVLRQYLSSVLLLQVMLLISPFSWAQGDFTGAVGSAHSLKTGALLYRETLHKLSATRYTVEYSEPNGQVFGHKTLDFSHSFITPSFSQKNDRNGEEISVVQFDNKLEVEYREDSQSKAELKTLDIEPGMVVDAGFDGFVKKYWSSLRGGAQMDVEYLVPTRQTTFSFRVAKTNCLDGTAQGAVCFSLTPVSWFVKLAVDPLVVAYDGTNKRLIRFTGRSNICDAQGNYDSVDIEYRYF